ncbi:MAG: hypothetical protein ACO3QC_03110 [Phycisphaerales bacterium]
MQEAAGPTVLVNETVDYALSVVVLPAIVGVVAAAPAMFGPLRRRSAAVECCVAFAVAIAFTVSFTRELGIEALLRQLVTLEGDVMPIERWHRLGLVAAGLAVVGPVLAALQAALASRRAERVVGVVGAVAVSAASVFVVEFPRATVGGEAMVAVVAVCSTLGFMLFARTGALWCAWLVFAALAALSIMSGFASLAVMCAAVSAGACAIGVLGFAGGHLARDAAPIEASGALAVVLGVLAALCAACGRAYDMIGLPAWSWLVVALIPLGGAMFTGLSRRAPSREATTFWRVLGAVILTILLLVGTQIAMQGGDSDAEDAGDPMDGIYG